MIARTFLNDVEFGVRDERTETFIHRNDGMTRMTGFSQRNRSPVTAQCAGTDRDMQGHGGIAFPPVLLQLLAILLRRCYRSEYRIIVSPLAKPLGAYSHHVSAITVMFEEL